MRALIVDDEGPARSKLKALLRNFDDIALAGEAAQAVTALELLSSQEVDVVFLDIEMPGMSGLELAARLPENVSVVFATAYHEHALRAFDLNAVDYLLKPFTLERLAETIARVRRERFLMAAGALPEANPLQNALHVLQPVAQHWLVQQRGHLQRIPLADIEWIDAADNYIEIHTAKQAVLDRITLAEFLQRVPGGQFVRVHRSCAINMAHFASLSPLSRGDAEVRLINGKALRVSRRYRAQLAALFA